jgi:sarcosine oxidase
MGAAASYNLARKGLRVLNIERFGVNHEKGSSHGRTRIIRLAYYEDPRYVPLLRRAYEAWREVESRSGKRLLAVTGGLMIGRVDGELVKGALKSASMHRIPHDVLSGKEAGERFEAFLLGEELSAVYDQSAGILFAEDCVRALVGLGSESGCEYRFAEEVKGWRRSGETIEVETSLGTRSASKLVLCAGAWNGGLLKGGIALRCERQVPFWFSSEGKERFSAAKMPVFIMEEDGGEYYYGVPEVGHGVKVARTHGGEFGDPDRVRREVTDADRAPVLRFVNRRINGLGEIAGSTTCLYTNTDDFNFALGGHPEEPGVTIVSACSGHGFKFASVVGEIVAAMVTEEEVAYDISFLDPRRLWTGQGRVR